MPTRRGGRLYLHSSSGNAKAWRNANGAMLAKVRAEWRSRIGGRAAQVDDSGPIVSNNGYAIGGYDPVAYLTGSSARKGSSSITQDWSGATWRFVSVANPSKYAPQFGGNCSYCMSNGSVTAGDGRYWNIVSGRLYLHSSQSYADKWPGEYAKRRRMADKKWRQVR
ncbi:MAG: hypothetical protein KTR21_08625 [Rhodobacteraceae bacterium]|nr:hypothetical protein [Paracoccaceae bacterium]